MSNTWRQWLSEHQEQYQRELLDFLRIPSISALPDHADAVQRAAEWVAARLTAAGVETVQVLPTQGHPVVYGEWLHGPEKPTILIYGHFDTQPADPLELWTDPPFEPVIREGLVYARGASDDKGNMLAPILAVEALLRAQGELPINVKFLFEGQEEIGSPHMAPFLASHRDLFACDLVVSADGGQWSSDQPILFVGLKGLCGLQIDVQGPAMDVHSGTYGGGIQNPIQALVHLLASLKNSEGTVLVDGFYDDVTAPTEADRARIGTVPFDESALLDPIGVASPFGEPGYTVLERLWMRPTLEFNGIWGGFMGDGVKTVIPSQAHAKITCRLVANQNPETVIARLTEHLERHAPPGVHVTVKPFSAHAKPYRMAADHPGNALAGEVLQSLYGKDPFSVMDGGTIPLYDLFQTYLNTDTVTFGFGLNEDKAHSPDESFGLDRFALGQQAYCLLLEKFGERATDIKRKRRSS